MQTTLSAPTGGCRNTADSNVWLSSIHTCLQLSRADLEQISSNVAAIVRHIQQWLLARHADNQFTHLQACTYYGRLIMLCVVTFAAVWAAPAGFKQCFVQPQRSRYLLSAKVSDLVQWLLRQGSIRSTNSMSSIMWVRLHCSGTWMPVLKSSCMSMCQDM